MIEVTAGLVEIITALARNDILADNRINNLIYTQRIDLGMV
uniref:Uncharacterized protein n=1 Tax=Klebsiella pneumoniae TaxID=573 RepID=A0A6G9HKN5_KLEPN|nr:hypothetical protein [Klebsiella pneumoniae]